MVHNLQVIKIKIHIISIAFILINIKIVLKTTVSLDFDTFSYCF